MLPPKLGHVPGGLAFSEIFGAKKETLLRLNLLFFLITMGNPFFYSRENPGKTLG